jgi:hypothetical protein
MCTVTFSDAGDQGERAPSRPYCLGTLAPAWGWGVRKIVRCRLYQGTDIPSQEKNSRAPAARRGRAPIQAHRQHQAPDLSGTGVMQPVIDARCPQLSGLFPVTVDDSSDVPESDPVS